jgi:hypothetical protein
MMHRRPAEKKSKDREESADLDEFDEILLDFPRVTWQCYNRLGLICNMKLENTPSNNTGIEEEKEPIIIV